MEEKYGKKIGQAKPLFVANSGIAMICAVFIIAGVAVLGYSISQMNMTFLAVGIVLLIVGILFLLYVIKIMSGGVFCYENGIVIKETFKVTEIKREDIAAIFWEGPGANASNSRVRTNVNTADIILVGGHKHYKISDGYYGNVDILGKYQETYKIPREIGTR